MAKGSASSSSSPSPSQSGSTVCCMCGDHGLAQELFRCKICIFRSQHKYCSDLYPRTKRYRVCNWCLREEGVKIPSPDTIADRELSRQNSYNKSNGDGVSVTLIGRACLLRLNKPIKKKMDNGSKKPLRILIRRPTSAGSETISMSPGSAMKGNKRLKTRVRRYKLLEEV